jgi:hypothetical protein
MLHPTGNNHFLVSSALNLKWFVGTTCSVISVLVPRFKKEAHTTCGYILLFNDNYYSFSQLVQRFQISSSVLTGISLASHCPVISNNHRFQKIDPMLHIFSRWFVVFWFYLHSSYSLCLESQNLILHSEFVSGTSVIPESSLYKKTGMLDRRS